MGSGIWDLHDDVDRLVGACEAWNQVSSTLESTADDVTAGAGAVIGAGWEGDSATSYDAHRKRLVADLDRAVTTAHEVAVTLAASAGSVRNAQGQLDQEWARVTVVPHTSVLGQVWFQPEDAAQEKQVQDSIVAAEAIRDQLDAALRKDAAALDSATATWQEISQEWGAVADGTIAPFTLPTEGEDTGVITDGDQTIVNTGAGDDEVRVSTDPFTGDRLVVVNGQVYRFPPGQAITIRGGGGNDTVTIGGATHIDVTVIGGEGDDKVTGGAGDDTIVGLEGDDQVDAGGGDDRVSGGEGRDYLDGQSGDDTLGGGTGDDTVYGLDGDDSIDGGEGDDYLEGALGADTVDGGEGDDVLSGGGDDDTLRGGAGDDVSYAGHGEDTTYGGSGSDMANSETGDREAGDVEDTVHVEIPDTTSYIKIEGSPEFQARIQADLDMLGSSPAGQQMLENLQRNYEDSGFLGMNKDSLTIREYDNPSDPDNSTASHRGNDFEININHRLDELGIGDGSTVEGPPIAVLYHELAHVYDYSNDTLAEGDYHGEDEDNQGTPNRERGATGLPIDHDDDPSTPEVIDPDHPYDLTENGLREEMGVDHRDHY